MKRFNIGIQMYSIREALWEDFRGVCKELVALGCDGVELAYYFGEMEPAELAAFFKEIGLTACGMMFDEKELYDPSSNVWEYARALKTPYVTVSKIDDFEECWPQVVAMNQKAGKEARRQGCQFTYHNHDKEFVTLEDGTLAYDKIMAACYPDLVQCEQDIYWIQKAGYNPIDFIRKYASRLPQIHLKDMDAATGGFTELGKGSMDIRGCIQAAQDSACQWLIYEQDQCKGNPMDSAIDSIQFLKSIL